MYRQIDKLRFIQRQGSRRGGGCE